MLRNGTLLQHGKGRTRLRRAGGAALAAALAVAVALTAGADSPAAAARAASGPTPPDRFGPLDPYLSFGWLPAGLKLVDGDILPQVVSIDAARHSYTDRTVWQVSAYAPGQCHLTAKPRGIKCTSAAYGQAAPFDGRAPDVAGHPAHWSGYWLVWQYAPRSWAFLIAPFPAVPYKGPKRTPKLVRQAVRIASTVKYGAATRALKWPVQLTGLPEHWQVSSVFYQPAAGVFEATRLALTTGTPDLGADGGLEYQSGIPYFGIQNATPHGFCYRYKKRKGDTDKSRVLRIHGHLVVVTNFPRKGFPGQGLCSAHAAGLSLSISEQGLRHPPMGLGTLFRDHLRVLGADPAKWTTQPVK